MVLKETILVLNHTVQSFLTEATTYATVQLSDLPFRSGYMLIFGLAIAASLASNAGEKVEEAIEESE